jgi:purine-cytosine permease-like protein
MMNEPEHSTKFWLGNAILAVAMLVLLFMGRLWEVMGTAAMVLWTALVIAGVYLLLTDKKGSSGS